jgi:6-pyruvoyltetrahydropterin/6-carboxytetrahydropterin synthase
VMDAKDLKKLAEDIVVDRLDHSNLNLDVEFVPKGMQTTTENLVILIWNQLKPHIIERGCELHCIKLVETENISCEYYGEEF